MSQIDSTWASNRIAVDNFNLHWKSPLSLVINQLSIFCGFFYRRSSSRTSIASIIPKNYLKPIFEIKLHVCTGYGTSLKKGAIGRVKQNRLLRVVFLRSFSTVNDCTLEDFFIFCLDTKLRILVRIIPISIERVQFEYFLPKKLPVSCLVLPYWLPTLRVPSFFRLNIGVNIEGLVPNFSAQLSGSRSNFLQDKEFLFSFYLKYGVAIGKKFL